jgi:ribose 5-phosphate isomerase B
MKRIVIAVDHGAIDLKKRIVSHLEKKGYLVDDLGVFSGESVDYPDIAGIGCETFLKGDYDYGILACGTGIGISISANKIDGIRCALPQNIFAARMAREHNNANMIAFGGRIDYPESVEDMIDAFDDSIFSSDERHVRRVTKMNGMGMK